MTFTILDAIGNTPLVEIKHLHSNPEVRILAKLEYFNPGGSIKDRPALYMIEAAEKSGSLISARTAVFATSAAIISSLPKPTSTSSSRVPTRRKTS